MTAGVDDVLALLVGAEPGELDLDGVGTGRDRPEDEGPLAAGDGRPGVAVASLIRLTVAPGTTWLLVSTTVPDTVPVSCAAAGIADNASTMQTRPIMMLLPCGAQ